MTVMNSSTFVGIYGSLTIHDWLEAVTLEEDAYSLFHSRAVSLGWATSSAGDPGSEHWGMNGAGLDWESDGTSAPPCLVPGLLAGEHREGLCGEGLCDEGLRAPGSGVAGMRRRLDRTGGADAPGRGAGARSGLAAPR
jgi:hypothetical protein